jgi:ketosteroid isomerase-like protein
MRDPLKLLMLVLFGVLTVACARVTAVAEQAQPPRPQGKIEPSAETMREIEAARAAFGEAYMKHDASALSALYHPDAVFAGTLHPYWLEGRSNVQRLWTYYFGTYPDARIVFWSSSFSALVPDSVVVQYATATMVMPDTTGRTRNVHMRLSIVWVRAPAYALGSRTLQWQIAHMHGSEAPLFR